jgi:tRNA (guanine-N7-)-methyltransferase
LADGLHLLDLGALEQPIHWDELFDWASDVHVLEMGFGDGASLLEMAQAAPEVQFIGIEVYRSGVGNLLNKIKRAGVRNLRVIMADAAEVLESAFADGSLDRIQLFFPDPWHKKRHHKRRLLDAYFVSLVVRKLKIGGVLHVATDWADYANQILSVLSAEPRLCNLAPKPHSFVSRPPSRPLTKYEKRGLRLGHEIVDIQFCKLS